MPPRAPRTPTSAPKPTPATAKDLERECRRQVDKIFDQPFTPVVCERYRAKFKRLEEEDRDARALFYGRTLDQKKALQTLLRHGLPPDAPLEEWAGHATTLIDLMLAYNRSPESPLASISQLRNDHRPPLFSSRTAFVVATFEEVWVGQKKKYLSDQQLAAISLLLEPKARASQLKNKTIREVLSEERRAIAKAREQHGELRTGAEKKKAGAGVIPHGAATLPE